MAVGMKELARLTLVLSLAALVNWAAPAHAQTIKLFLDDGSEVKLYEEKNSFALVIGINEYRHIRPLQNAERDAERVAAELRKHGFDVTLATDPNMTGAKLRKLVEEFVFEHGFEENSRVLIWYAGHGDTIDGEGYLLGVDAPNVGDMNSETLDEELREFYKASMPLRSFGIHLRQMRSRHVMLILDSCFAGTIFTNTRANITTTLNREMARPVRQIVTAGLAGEEVADNGRFADMFISAINGKQGPNGKVADQSNDKYLSGTELGYFLTINARSSDQTPQYGKLRRDVEESAANKKKTDQFELTTGEFFFLLPDFKPPENVVRGEADTTTVARAPDPIIWSPLASGTRIVNARVDPVPVFDTEPPAVGEHRFALSAGQAFPPAGARAAFEKATIGDREWLRFEHEGRHHYVISSDVKILGSN